MMRKIPYDRLLILIVLTLLAIDLAMVYSASSVISKEIYGASSAIFQKQLVSVTIGLLLMLTAMRINYQYLQHPLLIGGLVILSGALLIWALFSHDINGVQRWVQIGPLRFQPSELAKFATIALTAYFLVRRGGRVRELDRSALAYLLVVAALLGLVLLEPDFGTTTALGVTVVIMLFVGGLAIRYFLVALLLAAPAFYLLVYQVPYRRERLMAFWNPEADPFGSGYQILQSLIAVGSGGITGKGLAQGTQKLFFLPEPHTDFIYAVIGEEAGLWGCSLVLVLFALFFWRGVRAGLRSDSLFGTFLGLGIACMITFQSFFNMSVVLSLCPTKGIPLPFISVGGSSLIVMLAAVGILLNISRHSVAIPVKERS